MKREEAEALLPWYVAGALSGEESRAVRAFLDSGEIPPDALAELEHLQEAVAERGAEEPAYDPAILQRALARLDEVPQEPAPARAAGSSSSSGALGATWRRLAERLQWQITPPLAKVAIAAQFVLVLALAAALTLREPPESAGYQVVSGALVGQYTVGFAPGVSEAEVRQLLLEHRAMIVGGPSALGFYSIRFAEDVDPERAAAALAASGVTSFLEAVPES